MDFHTKSVEETGEWLRGEKFAEELISAFQGNVNLFKPCYIATCSYHNCILNTL